jgi:hypothetical protein
MTGWPMLLGCLAMIALAGVDALLDKTPRKPWSWRRPELEWWSTRRTKRERARVAVSIGKEV